MELFGEKALHSIAELCGVSLKNDQDSSSVEVEANSTKINCPINEIDSKTKYIIRRLKLWADL